jgi:sugar/nucleoside kinase (ribokinase family)
MTATSVREPHAALVTAGRRTGLDLLVLGDINPDLVLFSPGLQPAFGQAEMLVDDAHLEIGGSAAIMACGAARLGLRTAIAGVVGKDPFGSFMLEALVERGVDTSGVLVEPTQRTGLTVVLAREDDRAILTHAGAVAALRADAVDRTLLGRARHVHVASWFLQDALRPALGELFAGVRRAGATTSLDPNWDPSGDWDRGLIELLGEVDILLPNGAEAERIAGVSGAGEAARALARRGPLVAVKLGAGGALACRPDGSQVRAGVPAGMAVRDTVGAGDSFDAGLVHGMLGGASLERTLALACACGALSTRAAGGTAGQPTLDEARHALADGSAG